MTDDTGRHHASGIAPSHLSATIREEMLQMAQARLAPQFAETIQRARIHFLQPIVDLESPRLVFGRVVIIGDAAFVARPHVAMGVPKGAGDAMALVLAVQHGGSNILSALDQFEAQRLRIGRAIVARGRYLGSYMESQLKPAAERERAEQLRVFDQVMMETAMPMAFRSRAKQTRRPTLHFTPLDPSVPVEFFSATATGIWADREESEESSSSVGSFDADARADDSGIGALIEDHPCPGPRESSGIDECLRYA
jgi:FAD binding domain